MMDKDEIMMLLDEIPHPAINYSLRKLGILSEIKVEGDMVSAVFAFPFPIEKIPIADKIIGSVALLYSISTALGGKVATIEDMIISKEYRNLGYGKLLFNEALEFSKSRNCLRATLLTDFNNENAIRFYKKFGFFTSQMIPLRILL